MPTLDLNFGDVGKMPPEGVWRMIVKEAIVHNNKANDGQIIEFDAEFMDMPDDTFEGSKVFPKPNASLKPTARWKLQEVLSAITQSDWSDDGMQLEVEETEKDGYYRVPSLEDKTVLVIVKHGTYNNKPTYGVDTWIPDDGQINVGESVSPDGPTV